MQPLIMLTTLVHAFQSSDYNRIMLSISNISMRSRTYSFLGRFPIPFAVQSFAFTVSIGFSISTCIPRLQSTTSPVKSNDLVSAAEILPHRRLQDYKLANSSPALRFRSTYQLAILFFHVEAAISHSL